MDRYWAALEREFGRFDDSSVQIDCPFGAAPRTSRRAGRFSRAWSKYIAYPLVTAMQRGRDVVHVLDHSCSHLLKNARGLPRKIVTVHDLAPLRDARGLTLAQVKRFRKTVGHARAADLILTDSLHSKIDVIDLLGIPGERIAVLPLGVDYATFARHSEATFARLEEWPGYKRILSIGTAGSRKNLEIVPEVMRHVRKRIKDVLFVRVGDPLPGPLLADLRKAMPTGQIIELGSLFGEGDEPLAGIYQQADVLLFPSLLEGFGLPVLEAMAAGCPVACSNASSLPEVGGEAALYFDPRSPEEAAEKIIDVLTNAELRSALIAKGLRQAEALSWKNHAARLIDYYRGKDNGLALAG